MKPGCDIKVSHKTHDIASKMSHLLAIFFFLYVYCSISYVNTGLPLSQTCYAVNKYRKITRISHYII